MSDYLRTILYKQKEDDRLAEIAEHNFQKRVNLIKDSLKYVEKLSIEQALQILINRLLSHELNNSLDESKLILYYKEAFRKIKSEALCSRSPIKIEVGIFSYIDHQEFLEDASKINLDAIKDLKQWDTELKVLDRYSIHTRSINKLLSRMNTSYKHTSVSAAEKKQRVKKAGELICKILNNLSDEEIRELSNVSNGKIGLRNYVKSKISPLEYSNLFPGKNDFKNRWDKVNRERRNS